MGLAGRTGLVYWTGWVTYWVGLWVAYEHGLADLFIHFYTLISPFLLLAFVLSLCSLFTIFFFFLTLTITQNKLTSLFFPSFSKLVL